MSPRPPKYSFYLDENFPVTAGEFLQSLGHTVHYAHRETRRGINDLQQLRFATKMKWILLTSDQDFCHPTFASHWIKKSPGVIVIEADKLSVRLAQRLLHKALRTLTPNLIVGHVHVVSTSQVKLLEIED